MKKLFCVAALLINSALYSGLWDEKASWDQKFEDCIVAIEKNDIKFFKDNIEEIVTSKMLDFVNLEGYSKFTKVEEYYYYNLLSIAVKHARIEISEILIKYNKCFNYNNYKLFPLYWAVKNALDNAQENKLREHDRDLVELLLDNGFNPYTITSKDNNQFHAFDMAIEKNNLELIKLFVEADKKQKFIKFGVNGTMPLSIALSKKNEAITLYLIESDESQEGELINDKDNFKLTPLHYAALRGQSKCLELLITRGAALNNQTHKVHECSTALHHAAQKNDSKILNALIESGAHPAIKNLRGSLPENLTIDEENKLLLKNACAIQELCTTFSENKLSENFFSLITSFTLLSFTMHQMHSPVTFGAFYTCMRSNENFIKNIAQLLDKKTFENKTDFKDALLHKAALRLKAHFYNNFIISEHEYIKRFGEDEFKKMLVTANRIKNYKEKN